MALIAVISDTHLPRADRWLPELCVEHIRGADLVLHAGDVVSTGVLARIEALGPPVFAVHGNADEPALRELLPAQRVVAVEGVQIAMTHNGGPAAGRLERMRARFGDAAALVFGHSHVPLHETTADGAFQIFNPGSATDRRRQPRHTMGLARVSGDQLSLEIVALD